MPIWKAPVDGVEQLGELGDGLFGVPDVLLDRSIDEISANVFELKVRIALITLGLDKSPGRCATTIVVGQGGEHLPDALVVNMGVD